MMVEPSTTDQQPGIITQKSVIGRHRRALRSLQSCFTSSTWNRLIQLIKRYSNQNSKNMVSKIFLNWFSQMELKFRETGKSLKHVNLKILPVTCFFMALWYHLCLLYRRLWVRDSLFLQKYFTNSLDSTAYTESIWGKVENNASAKYRGDSNPLGRAGVTSHNFVKISPKHMKPIKVSL